MKVSFKKIAAFALAGSMVLSMQFTNVHAETKASITLNGVEEAFSDLFKVRDGKIYVPIKLFYPSAKKDGIEIKVAPSISLDNVAISASKDGVTERKGLYITWSDSVKTATDENGEEYVNGRLLLCTYKRDENGIYDSDPQYFQLDAPVILENLDGVGGGGRLYVSLNTLEVITQFLLGDFTSDGYTYIVETN